MKVPRGGKHQGMQLHHAALLDIVYNVAGCGNHVKASNAFSMADWILCSLVYTTLCKKKKKKQHTKYNRKQYEFDSFIKSVCIHFSLLYSIDASITH